MIDFLTQIDVFLFFFINHNLQNSFFDWLMPIVTEQRNWFPVFAVVYLWLWWKGGKTGRTAALLIIPVVLLSDQLSSAALKPFFQRVRPCVALEGVNAITGISTSFSFPSSHAVNSFAAAMLFTHFYPAQKWPLFICAFLSGFSRIYLGKHYPFDVIGGAVIGVLCALVVIKSYEIGLRRYQLGRKQNSAG